MLSIHKVKELLNDKTISDKEAEEIRSVWYALASVALDAYKEHLRGHGDANSCSECRERKRRYESKQENS